MDNQGRASISTDVAVSRHVEHADYLGTKTFGSLDGLRAISILGVLWHHASQDWLTWTIAQRGFLGVDLFFEISGFLIVTLLLRERDRAGRISLRRFYLRRALRIFPPYYATLIVAGLISFFSSAQASLSIRHDLPYAALYLSNLFPMGGLLGITWSLSTEEQFYLFVPALEKLWGHVFPKLLPFVYLLVILPPFGVFPSLRLPPLFRQTTFGPILLGVMLAHALHRPGSFEWIYRWLGRRWVPVLSAALVVLACCHPASDISGWPRLFVHASMLLLLASCVIREQHTLAPLLRLWPLRRIGAVSYGIYLYHMLVMHVVFKVATRMRLTPPLLVFLVLILAVWGFAELSFRLFESRFLALKEKLTV